MLKTSGADTDAWFATLKGKIEAGEMKFEDAAKQYSTCPSSAKGGDLGTFSPGTMVPEFEAVVFDDSIPIGELRMVKTKFGTHLVKTTEREQAGGD